MKAEVSFSTSLDSASDAVLDLQVSNELEKKNEGTTDIPPSSHPGTCTSPLKRLSQAYEDVTYHGFNQKPLQKVDSTYRITHEVVLQSSYVHTHYTHTLTHILTNTCRVFYMDPPQNKLCK